ncbi:type II secretion system secretin GspD [Acidovorax sp. 62]|uniref:type II secretion system secretin GspD n=1 Tax=Acidovorax sp. 62 TaxID=2035203 RepID=UPI000C17BCD7|nr:type II secretion system secretin GspD [Acidovorax sp. 62]
MNSSRYVLAASVIAACQLAQAQPVPTTPAVSAQPVPQSSSAPQPTSQTPPEKPRVAGEKAAVDGKPAPESLPEAEPRIIRGSGQVIAAPKAVAAVSGAPVSFRFEEAPVAEVIRTVLGDILGVDYVMHPPLQGTVTLATRNPIAPDQAVFLLESALQANGLALVRDARGTFHAGRADALKGISGSVRQMGGSSPVIAPGYGAVIIPLQYIGAAEMASILRPMVSADALVRVDSVRNLLVMMGTRTQAEGWMELVNTFDVDLLKGMSVGVFPLKYASVKEVEAALRLVSGGGVASAPATATGVSAAGGALSAAGGGTAALGEGNPLFGALRIMPIERINSILVVTPRASYLEEAKRWIDKLDKPSDGGSEPQLYIYQVQNGNARHLAGVLAGLFGGSGSGAGSANSGVAPGLGATASNTFGQSGVSNAFGGNTFGSAAGSASSTRLGSGNSGSVGLNSSNTRNTQGASGQASVSATLGTIRVVADELNNSVLIWGTRAEFNKIEAALKRLDLPLTQVLIDASIIEVTLNDDLQYGLKWAFSGDAQSGYSGSGTVGSIPALAQGFTYTLKNAAGVTKATLSALAEKSLVKMLSNPSLMVLDNHTATITVGDQIPVATSSTATPTTGSTTTTTTIQYKDTGVNLSVTPSVTAGNIVAMQIDQTVTDAGSPDTKTTAGGGERPFLQRQISSKVAVRSGESIVLGGLIKNNQTNKKSGVPLLQDIPLVGNLFTEKVSTGVRTELLVIITPRVVRSDVDIREVSEDLRERLRGLKDISSNKEANRPQAAEPFVPATAN